VTDEERDYMYKVYVKDPKARINLGIRHRLAPLMGNNRKKIELLNCLLFSLPGTPVLYYGDEIGMGDNFYLGDRDGVRTPMQWSSDRNAGFSEANPQKLYLPVILDPEYHYEAVNVEIQSWNTSSLLWWMKRLINKRKQYKPLSRGDMKFISSDNPKILAFTRSYAGQTMLVLVNLSRYTQPVELDLREFSGYNPVEVFSKNIFPIVKSDIPYFITLGGHDCEWFIMDQSKSLLSENQILPLLELDTWEEILNKAVIGRLEAKIFPAYLMQVRWFGGKGRVVESMEIIHQATIALQENSAVFFLIQVAYQSGLPEIYQLPVSFANQALAMKLQDSYPKAVISRMRIHGDEGVLYDALYGAPLQEAMIGLMARNLEVRLKGSKLVFSSNERMPADIAEHENLKPKVLSGEQSNTSIAYGNRFFLKIFRKVDRAINPDLEVTKYLTEYTSFRNIPAFVGSIEWRFEKDSLVVGMMQELIESSGDAWVNMLDRLNHFNEMILVGNRAILPGEPMGSLIEPVSYDYVPAEVKELIDASTAEQARLLGVRTAEMHQALASGTSFHDFKPEPYSLHYQRSLYAGLQSLVRGTFHNQSKNLQKLSEETRQDALEVLGMKDKILEVLRRIYKKKIEVTKIRIHGDYHLGQVLFTGKDYVIMDFEGEPARSYSERRLKRSPMRDVAGMIRSFHYAAYGSLVLDTHIRKEDFSKLLPFVEQWYHYMSGFFMKAYLETAEGSAFIPKNKDDLETLLTTFLLEKAIYELNYELNNRPGWVMIPLRGIKDLMKKDTLLSV